MNNQRYVISREGRGYIVWDREAQCKQSVIVRPKADAQAEVDRLNNDEACSICGNTGEVEDEEGFWTDCPCRDTQPDADAIMDAAHDERVALPAWEAQRERDREARPVPAGLEDMPW